MDRKSRHVDEHASRRRRAAHRRRDGRRSARRVASRALGVPAIAAARSAASRTTMGVSPSTVVEAYDRLGGEGLIRSRPGSGFYVSPTALAPLALAADEPPRDRAVDPFWVSRQSLDADAGHAEARAAAGCPADWMPTDAVLRRALRDAGPGRRAPCWPTTAPPARPCRTCGASWSVRLARGGPRGRRPTSCC